MIINNNNLQHGTGLPEVAHKRSRGCCKSVDKFVKVGRVHSSQVESKRVDECLDDTGIVICTCFDDYTAARYVARRAMLRVEHAVAAPRLAAQRVAGKRGTIADICQHVGRL